MPPEADSPQIRQKGARPSPRGFHRGSSARDDGATRARHLEQQRGVLVRFSNMLAVRVIVYIYAPDSPHRLKDLSPKRIKKHNL